MTELADGVVALEAPAVSVARTVVLRSRRSGLLLSGCLAASISHTLPTANTYGLVVDGEHTEEVLAAANAIFGNTGLALATGLGLSIPPPPELAEALGSDGE